MNQRSARPCDGQNASHGVFALVVTVMVDDPVPVTVVGLKLAVAPVGSPLTPNPVLPVNPFSAVTVAV